MLGACGAAPSCVRDDDCTGGIACENGACVDPPTGGAECNLDSECGTGEVCEAGVCVLGGECTFDGDGASGELCFDGRCQAAPECLVDADCPLAGSATSACVGRRERVGIMKCSSDTDCTDGQTRISMRCVTP